MLDSFLAMHTICVEDAQKLGLSEIRLCIAQEPSAKQVWTSYKLLTTYKLEDHPL